MQKANIIQVQKALKDGVDHDPDTEKIRHIVESRENGEVGQDQESKIKSRDAIFEEMMIKDRITPTSSVMSIETMKSIRRKKETVIAMIKQKRSISEDLDLGSLALMHYSPPPYNGQKFPLIPSPKWAYYLYMQSNQIVKQM